MNSWTVWKYKFHDIDSISMVIAGYILLVVLTFQRPVLSIVKYPGVTQV